MRHKQREREEKREKRAREGEREKQRGRQNRAEKQDKKTERRETEREKGLLGRLRALLERHVDVLGALLRRFGSAGGGQGTLGASGGALGESFWTSRELSERLGELSVSPFGPPGASFWNSFSLSFSRSVLRPQLGTLIFKNQLFYLGKTLSRQIRQPSGGGPTPSTPLPQTPSPTSLREACHSTSSVWRALPVIRQPPLVGER